MESIKDNLTEVLKRIREYEIKYQRHPNSVALLAATKQQPLEKMQAAVEAGQHIFGENYLQEAIPKMEALHNKKLEWHYIGPLQSNKAKKIAENFSWIESVDSMKNATRLNESRPAHLPPLNICIEVNISGEETKSGVHAESVLPLAEFCISLDRLRLRGLMAIPAPQKSLQAQRAEFQKLKILFDQLNKKDFALDTLSMGMSHDFEAAIAEGSTLVRIGTAIFGERV